MIRLRIGSVAALAWILMTGIALAQQDRSSLNSWQSQPAVTAHGPAARFAQYEPRRRIRRVPAEQHSSASSGPAYAMPFSAGNCPAPYKEAFGACVRQCPGGFEDRGSVGNFIRGN
jgi:hypothetical protein